MKNVDDARKSFDLLVPELSRYQADDISEADTRSKVIDSILIDVLGWSEDDIKREEHSDVGYYDYRVSAPGFAFIVEAKRNYSGLKLPTKASTVSLQTLLTANREVIEQIRGYLGDHGLTYGVITNGRQFIVAKFYNQDGTSWKGNTALVFDGLDKIQERFIDFHNNLSKATVIENGGFQFDSTRQHDMGRSLIGEAYDRSKEITRNTISSKLASIIDSIFGDIFTDALENDEEFLKECFVENNETQKNREEIERLFGDYAPKLEKVVAAQNADSIQDQVTDDIDGWGNLTGDRAPNPVIFIGSKGVGKTTFINYLIKHKFQSKLRDRNLFVYLDFRKYFEDAEQFDAGLISQQVIDSLLYQFPSLNIGKFETLSLIYKREIAYYESNIWKGILGGSEDHTKKLQEFFKEKLSNPLVHLEKVSLYLLHNQRRRLAIVLDNCDQFDEGIQKKVFMFGHSLQRKAKCGVIVSLREGYYYRWQVQPPFDAYVSNVYHISAPPYGYVLQKRIAYTLKKLNQRKQVVTGDLSTGAHLSIKLDKIIQFLESLNQSLFHSDNDEIVSFLRFTTFPNIREGLGVFKSYLTSGHTNVEEIVLRESAASRGSRGSLIPFHEFVKAVALQSKFHYNHQTSIVKNLFYPEEGSNDHFLKLRIIQYLLEMHKAESPDNRYEDSKRMTQEFVDLGYRVRDIRLSTDTLFRWGMIDSKDLLSDIDWMKAMESEAQVGITSKGYYYFNELIWRFTYLDLVLQDTPVYAIEAYEKIRQQFPPADDLGKRALDKRLGTTRAFVEYLVTREALEAQTVIARFGRIWSDILLPRFEENERLVRRRLDRSMTG
jgi:hypothetical protein